MADESIRVALGVGDFLSREGLRSLIAEVGRIVDEADDGEELLELLGDGAVDVAVIDPELPYRHDAPDLLELHRRIRDVAPEVGLVVVGGRSEVPRITGLLERSPERFAFLLRENLADPGVLHRCFSHVMAGGTMLDPEVVRDLVAPTVYGSRLDVLSPREREVLRLMAQGLQNSGIAHRVALSERAVEKSITAIFDKLEVPRDADHNRRVAAVAYYLRHTQPDDPS